MTTLSLILPKDPLHQQTIATTNRLRRAASQAHQACRLPASEPAEVEVIRTQIRQLQQRLATLEAT
jgi:hypothetical protein